MSQEPLSPEPVAGCRSCGETERHAIKCWFNTRCSGASSPVLDSERQQSGALSLIEQAERTEPCNCWKSAHMRGRDMPHVQGCAIAPPPAAPGGARCPRCGYDPAQWVTVGRIKIDIETETETFERSVAPPALEMEVHTAPSGRRYVDIDEVVKQEMERIDRSVVQPPADNSFKAYLDEQLKDPAFAAAYTEISAEVDADFARQIAPPPEQVGERGNTFTLIVESQAASGTRFALLEDEKQQYVATWREDDADEWEVFSEAGNRISANTEQEIHQWIMTHPASETTPQPEAEVRAVLDSLGNKAIRVREGGGPEDIFASLAVTVAKLAAAPNAEAVERAARRIIEKSGIGKFLDAQQPGLGAKAHVEIAAIINEEIGGR